MTDQMWRQLYENCASVEPVLRTQCRDVQIALDQLKAIAQDDQFPVASSQLLKAVDCVDSVKESGKVEFGVNMLLAQISGLYADRQRHYYRDRRSGSPDHEALRRAAGSGNQDLSAMLSAYFRLNGLLNSVVDVLASMVFLRIRSAEVKLASIEAETDSHERTKRLRELLEYLWDLKRDGYGQIESQIVRAYSQFPLGSNDKYNGFELFFREWCEHVERVISQTKDILY